MMRDPSGEKRKASRARLALPSRILRPGRRLPHAGNTAEGEEQIAEAPAVRWLPPQEIGRGDWI